MADKGAPMTQKKKENTRLEAGYCKISIKMEKQRGDEERKLCLRAER